MVFPEESNRISNSAIPWEFMVLRKTSTGKCPEAQAQLGSRKHQHRLVWLGLCWKRLCNLQASVHSRAQVEPGLSDRLQSCANTSAVCGWEAVAASLTIGSHRTACFGSMICSDEGQSLDGVQFLTGHTEALYLGRLEEISGPGSCSPTILGT